ncbi:DMT family transporter [Cohnella pontilimi]|uniref:DMT family transporter n=1 Tax=Cohnella pontilimi TaxID=2564100 RepID=A0A4U0FDW0_9BACL|nr:DMT family transporter [Cohnella pontilimi]TJY42444.1 DMT family transporter [Cohnella pontilimi]
MNSLSRSKSIVLITFLVLVWGVSWPIYKMALAYTPPLLFAAIRTVFGGLLIVLFYFKKRNLIRWKENWPVYVISSIFNVALFYGLQTIGLLYVPSGLFSVIVYLQPVLVGIMAWMWLGETMSITKIAGLILGVVGVAAVSAGGISGHVAVIGIVLAVITALSWALGTIYVKKVSGRVDSVWLVAFQCLIGGLFLTGAGSATETWSEIVWNAPLWSGLVFGTILGISASWMVYITLINAGDASKVASYTFLVPLISVFSGTLFLHEPFTIYLVLGLVLIAVSIYMVNRKSKSAVEQAKMAALVGKAG